METQQKKIPVRKVDTQTFLGAIKDMVREGHDVPVTITGGSMTPFLVHGRDRVILSKISRPLKTGDMVLYQRESGQYVMHRIRYIKNIINSSINKSITKIILNNITTMIILNQKFKILIYLPLHLLNHPHLLLLFLRHN